MLQGKGDMLTHVQHPSADMDSLGRAKKAPFAPIHVKLCMTVHSNAHDLSDLSRAAEALGKLGFWGIEPDIIDSSRIEGRALAAIVLGQGLHVSALATGRGFTLDHLSLSDKDPVKRQMAIDRVRSHIDLACELQSNVIIGLLRGLRSDEDTVKACLSRLCDSLAVCALHASRSGCRIFLEALNRNETNIANTAAQAATLIAATASPVIKLLLDTFHLDQEEHHIYETLHAHSLILGHFHLADKGRGVPGTAGIDFRGIIECLHEVGYNKSFSIEVPLLPDVETCARQARERLHGMGIYSYGPTSTV